MPTLLPIALFNYKNGGRTSPGNYDFTGLEHAFSSLREAPALIILCEAKEWGYWGGESLYRVARAVSHIFKIPYQARLAHIDRGDFGPTVLFNPNLLSLHYWGDRHNSVPDDKRNVIRFGVWNTDALFDVSPEHWDFRSGRARMPYAERLETYGTSDIPMLVAGDFNETASGLHLPQIDWENASSRMRKQKGKQYANGSWGPHTDAVDWLIGKWDNQYQWDQSATGRCNGASFHMVAEMAALNMPLEEVFIPTARGSRLLIDMLLVNNAWVKRGGLMPTTYKVIGADVPGWPSDHFMVCATLYL